MANSRLSLFNQAVTAAGGAAEISEPDETSREANLCRLWYDIVRDNVQQAGPWSSTNASMRLNQQAERDFGEAWVGLETEPGPGWAYSYVAPTDMLRPQHLFSYARFERQVVGDRVLIMTNEESPILRYTKVQENVGMWDTTLYLAVVYSLAEHITFSLSKKATLLDRLQTRAQNQILLAMTEVANEEHTRPYDHPAMLSIRDFETPPVSDRYVFPFQSLNVVPA